MGRDASGSQRTCQWTGAKLFRWRGVMLVAFLQAAPVAIVTDSEPRFVFGIGAGGVDYQQFFSSCAPGESVTRNVEMRTLTGLVDYLFENQSLRLSAFGGTIESEVFGDNTPRFRNPPDGGFAGVMGGIDTDRGAAQIGLLRMPTGSGLRTSAVVHMRIGKRDGFHFQGDANVVRGPGQLPSTGVGLGFGDANGGQHSVHLAYLRVPLPHLEGSPRSHHNDFALEATVRAARGLSVAAGIMPGVELWHAGVRIDSNLWR